MFFSWQVCSCGDSIASYNNVSDTNCNLPCYGNTLYNIEYCGGISYYSVYSTGRNLSKAKLEIKIFVYSFSKNPKTQKVIKLQQVQWQHQQQQQQPH